MTTFLDHKDNEYEAQTVIKATNAVNGERSLTGTIYTNEEVLNKIDKGWKIKFQDEFYRVIFAKPIDTGNKIQVDFDAVHQFFYDFDKSSVHSQLQDGSHTFQTYLNFIFDGSGYSYNLEVTVNALNKQSFGYKSRLDLFNDIVKSSGIEFFVSGKVVRILQKTGTDLSTIVRKNFNMNELGIEKKINDFVTYQKGFGAWNNKDDHSKGRLEVEYISPLASEYGIIEAEPLVDERYTNSDSLLAVLKQNVDSSYSISVQIDMEDLTKAGYQYTQPVAGDYIMAINETVGFKEKIRIVSFTSEYDVTGKLISHKVTCNDIGTVKKQSNVVNRLSGQLNSNETKLIEIESTAKEALVSADGKNTNYYGTEMPVDSPKGTLKTGDLLFLTVGDTTKQYYWNGAEWIINPFSNDIDFVKKDINDKISEVNAAIKDGDDALNKKYDEIVAKTISQDTLISQAQSTADSAKADATTALQNIVNESNNLQDSINLSKQELTLSIQSVDAKAEALESEISNAKATLTNQGSQLANIETRTKTVEDNISGLTTKYQNIQIGGSNLLTNTSSDWINLTTNRYAGFVRVLKPSDLPNIKIGDKLTFSIDIKSTSSKQLRARISIEGTNPKTYFSDIVIKNGDGRSFVTAEVSTGWTQIILYIDANLTSTTVTADTVEQYRRAKLELGTLATDYSIADLDFKNDLATYKQTTEQNYASLNQTIQSVDGKVTQNTNTITQNANETNTRLTSLETYKDSEGTRATSYFEASKTETARQITAERTVTATNYIAKSQYTQDVSGITSRLTATEQVADETKKNLATYKQTIDQNTAQIAENKQTVDGTLSSLQTQVTQNKNDIATKASQLTVNNLSGRMSSAETTITQNANEISTRLSQTNIESLITSKATVITDNKVKETSDSFSREITRVEGLVGDNSYKNISLGVRNFLASKYLVNKVSSQSFDYKTWATDFVTSIDLPNILKSKETYTLSFDAEIIKKSTVATIFSLQVGFAIYSPSNAHPILPLFLSISNNNAIQNLNQKGRLEKTFVCPTLATDSKIIVYTNRYSDGTNVDFDTVRFTNVNIVAGNTESKTWIKPIEDTDEDIGNLTIKYNTVKDTVDSHTQQIGQQGSSLTTTIQRVDSIQSSVSNIDGRLSTVTQTADGLVTTVQNLSVGGNNLLLNADFELLENKTSFTVGGVTYSQGPKYWSTYNGGIPNPGTSFHAYSGSFGGRNNVVIFNESDGSRNWKAINQSISKTFMPDFPDTTNDFTLSFDAYADLSGAKIFGGFYYVNKLTGTANFHAGQFTVNLITSGSWNRYSVKVPFNKDNCDFSKTFSFLIYGYGFSSNAILALDNVKLETGTISSAFSKSKKELDDQISSIQTTVTQTANSWAVKNLTSNGSILSQINLTDGTVKIDGKYVKITGQTLIDNGIITNAMIKDLTADKIIGGTIDANKISVINLNASNITSGQISGGLIKGGVLTALNGAMSIDLNNGQINTSQDTSSIRRTSSDSASQFIRFEDGGLNTVPGGGIKAAHTIVGSNYRGNESTSDGFAGLEIYSGHYENFSRLIGDRIEFRANQSGKSINTGNWVFDFRNQADSFFYPQKGDTNHKNMFLGHPSSRITNVFSLDYNISNNGVSVVEYLKSLGLCMRHLLNGGFSDNALSAIRTERDKTLYKLGGGI